MIKKASEIFEGVKSKRKIKKKVPLERDILNDVCKWLQDNEFFFWRSNNIPVFGRNNAGKMAFRSMPKFSVKGVPDIIVIFEGVFIGIEVKKPSAPLRPDQIIFREKCVSNGAQYHVVYSLGDCIEIMSKYVDPLK
jgi:hypothetical protein